MVIEEAIILAGGMGTRLKSVISDIPKPLAPINNIPFLTYLLHYLKNQGIKHIVLSVGYKHEMIESLYKDDFEGIKISYTVEKNPLGTGGGIALALKKTSSDNILILNGDSFINLNLKKFSTFHLENKSKLSFALKEMRNFDRYGCIEIKNNIINKFKEKQFVERGFINGGVYIAKRNIFDGLNLGEKFSFEQDFLEKKVSEREFYGYRSDGYFIDIGIPEDYEKAQTELINEINI